ncbi:hypothetical protein GCM10023148_04430 [Actinokineospora soli]
MEANRETVGMVQRSITQEEALRRFPELAELVVLREHGWRFHLLGEPGGPSMVIRAGALWTE